MLILSLFAFQSSSVRCSCCNIPPPTKLVVLVQGYDRRMSLLDTFLSLSSILLLYLTLCHCVCSWRLNPALCVTRYRADPARERLVRAGLWWRGRTLLVRAASRWWVQWQDWLSK